MYWKAQIKYEDILNEIAGTDEIRSFQKKLTDEFILWSSTLEIQAVIHGMNITELAIDFTDSLFDFYDQMDELLNKVADGSMPTNEDKTKMENIEDCVNTKRADLLKMISTEIYPDDSDGS